MKIKIPARIVDIPDGDYCYYYDSKKRKWISCQFYYQYSDYAPSIEVQQSESGVSSGSITFNVCRLFDQGLSLDEDGISKHGDCLFLGKIQKNDRP